MLLIWANPSLFLMIFFLSEIQLQMEFQFQLYKLKKSFMLCLGFELGAAG